MGMSMCLGKRPLNVLGNRLWNANVLDSYVLAHVQGACHVLFEQPQMYRNMQKWVSSKLHREKERKILLATMVWRYMGLKHKLSLQQMWRLRKPLVRFPMQTLALLSDKRFNQSLRNQLFAALKQYDATQVVLIVAALSKGNIKKTKDKHDHALSRVLASIERRGSVFLDQFQIDKKGRITSNWSNFAKTMIPGWSAVRLKMEGKQLNGSDMVWLAADGISAAAMILTFGGSALLVGSLKTGRGVGIATKVAQLSNHIMQMKRVHQVYKGIHHIARTMSFSGRAFRWLHRGQLLAKYTTLLRSPAFWTATCVGAVGVAGALAPRIMLQTNPDQTKVRQSMATILAAAATGAACWKFSGKSMQMLTKLANPRLVVRLMTSTVNGISKIKLYKFSGKPAVDGFLRWFRHTGVGKRTYFRTVGKTVNQGIKTAGKRVLVRSAQKLLPATVGQSVQQGTQVIAVTLLIKQVVSGKLKK